MTWPLSQCVVDDLKKIQAHTALSSIRGLGAVIKFYFQRTGFLFILPVFERAKWEAPSSPQFLESLEIYPG